MFKLVPALAVTVPLTVKVPLTALSILSKTSLSVAPKSTTPIVFEPVAKAGKLTISTFPILLSPAGNAPTISHCISEPLITADIPDSVTCNLLVELIGDQL